MDVVGAARAVAVARGVEAVTAMIMTTMTDIPVFMSVRT